jgi:hypothetical protein
MLMPTSGEDKRTSTSVSLETVVSCAKQVSRCHGLASCCLLSSSKVCTNVTRIVLMPTFGEDKRTSTNVSLEAIVSCAKQALRASSRSS